MRRRGIWIIAFFAAAVVIMAIGAMVPISHTDAEPIYNEFENELKYIATVPGIFGNNFFHSLIMFTPFVGPLYGGFVFFNTGTILEIIAIVQNTNTGLLFVTLFLFPHTWLEFFAYSLAMSQSVFLSMAIVRGRFRQELVRTCVIMAVCALILLLAALAEVIIISASG
jgi:hypothetical protein